MHGAWCFKFIPYNYETVSEAIALSSQQVANYCHFKTEIRLNKIFMNYSFLIFLIMRRIRFVPFGMKMMSESPKCESRMRKPHLTRNRFMGVMSGF